MAEGGKKDAPYSFLNVIKLTISDFLKFPQHQLLLIFGNYILLPFYSSFCFERPPAYGNMS
jgi:hypothetical protein